MSATAVGNALFTAGSFRADEITAGDVPELQRFYEANPEYHLLVTGVAPSANAGQETFDARPPDGWHFKRKWMIAFRDERGAMVAIADVVEDLLAEHVWHIGLFIVATRLHSGGAARETYRALESWMHARGATWSRLGVVVANPRAERFWRGQGYAQVRTRDDVRMGERTHTLRTMMKPLAIGSGTLTLVPQTAAHAQEMFAVLSDPALYEYENEPPASLEWLRERFAKLESRQSADGRERWLNWIIRIPSGELIGYVQATVRPDGTAGIAYVLASAFWGRGLARAATEAMIKELVENYAVRMLTAVLKRKNHRSVRLLERLGFSLATPELHAKHEVEADEILMLRKIESAIPHPV